MSVPSTSTGPRMYLDFLSSEQVTSGLAGSSTAALTASGLLQSSLVNWSRISGVTQAGSLALAGVALGVAVLPLVPVSVGAAVVGAGVGSAIKACGTARFADVAALVAGVSGVKAGGGV